MSVTRKPRDFFSAKNLANIIKTIQVRSDFLRISHSILKYNNGSRDCHVTDLLLVYVPFETITVLTNVQQ